MIDVNVGAVTVLAHLFTGALIQRGAGGIMLFGSIVGRQGVPQISTYAATKAYIQTFAEGLHAELRPLGVDVLCVLPGPVSSGFGGRPV
jgi:short-subunit dehydrogenase